MQDIPIEETFEETKEQTYKVLIVDDNFFNVDVLAQIVHFNCWDVSEIIKCFSGREALENIRMIMQEQKRIRSTKTIDFAFLDINMPEMTGFELAEKIRTLYANSDFKVPILCAVTA